MDGVSKTQSVRRKSKVLGLRRQSYYRRKAGNRPEEVDRLIADHLHSVVGTYLAWGFWMVYYFLRNQGHLWNHKRVYRVWKAEGLHLRKVPKRARIKRKALDLISPAYLNQGWAMDFLSDWVVGMDQKKVRLINIMDECSRKALWTEAYTSIPARKLIQILEKLVQWRGVPQYIRCDNGPEFISHELNKWAASHGIEIRFIQPGKPTQNGLIERLNGTLRRECLDLQWFDNLADLNQALQQWWGVYNSIRPHSSIGYKAPDEFEHRNKNFYFRAVAA